MRFVVACCTGLALILTACSRPEGLQSKAAIQAAIERRVQQRSNLAFSTMTIEVQDVKFDDDRAEAEVKFRSKQAPDAAIGVHYVLRRVGDHWEVESSSATSGMGGSAHGAGQAPSPAPSPGPSPPAPQASH
jgi:hypothetical protein